MTTKGTCHGVKVDHWDICKALHTGKAGVKTLQHATHTGCGFREPCFSGLLPFTVLFQAYSIVGKLGIPPFNEIHTMLTVTTRYIPASEMAHNADMTPPNICTGVMSELCAILLAGT